MKSIFTSMFIFCSFISFSQTQITDLYSDGIDKSSYPNGYIEFAGKIFFVASTEHSGREIWVYNPNVANSEKILKDINVGESNSVNIFDPFILGESLYFFASDGSSSGELWKTDGTENGTIKITDFLNYSFTKNEVSTVNNQIFMIAKGGKLWKSDGTKTGTTLIKGDIPMSNKASYANSFNNLFLFTIQTPSTNHVRIWRSDGTNEGTFPISPINTDGIGVFGSNAFTQYIKFKNELYFVARNSNLFSPSVGIMKTDGTENGTVALKSIYNGNQNLMADADVIMHNEKLYFSFLQNDRNSFFVWETDGEEINTKKIYNYTDSNIISSNLIINENNLSFVLDILKGDSFIIDIDTENLTHVKTILPKKDTDEHSLAYSRISYLKISDNKKFISVPKSHSFSDSEGYIYSLIDNKIERAPFLDDYQTTAFHYPINYHLITNDILYFTKESEIYGRELWVTDLTEENTKIFSNINKSKSGLNSNPIEKTNSHLFFHNYNYTTNKYEFISYNNETQAFSVLKDLNTNNSISPYIYRISHNNSLYFSGFEDTVGVELWKTDGTEGNTSLVSDIKPGTTSSNPTNLTLHKDKIYFTSSESFNEEQNLFTLENSIVSNVLSAGSSGTQYNRVENIVSSNNNLFFVLEANGTVPNLSILNESENELTKLKEFGFDTNDEFITVNNILFFSAQTISDYNNEVELYKSDGTPEGTVGVKNIETGFSSFPSHLINNNNTLYFSAETSTTGRELWLSDGTESGTKPIKDINPGVESAISPLSSETYFEILSGEVYFSANDGINGTELWKSDGTEAGTILVKDINIGSEASNPKYLTRIGDKIYFQAYDKTHGSELWKTDGTEAGTVLVSDVIPGEIGSSPLNIINIDTDVFFMAFTLTSGRQIWKLENEASLSVKNLESDNTTFIYPNPSSNFISIKTNDNVKNIKIYNLTGQLVKSSTDVSEKKIDISQLKKGVYLIKYEVKGIQFFKKFIKE